MPSQRTKPNTLQLFEMLNRSSGETTSSFFLKKISNTEKNSTKSFKILLILIQIKKKAKNTEGPLRKRFRKKHDDLIVFQSLFLTFTRKFNRCIDF
jgi:hypothetical protein